MIQSLNLKVSTGKIRSVDWEGFHSRVTQQTVVDTKVWVWCLVHWLILVLTQNVVTSSHVWGVGCGKPTWMRDLLLWCILLTELLILSETYVASRCDVVTRCLPSWGFKLWVGRIIITCDSTYSLHCCDVHTTVVEMACINTYVIWRTHLLRPLQSCNHIVLFHVIPILVCRRSCWVRSSIASLGH